MENQLEYSGKESADAAVTRREALHNDGGQFGHISGKLWLATSWAILASFSFGLCGVCIGGILVNANFGIKFAELAHLKEINGIASIFHAGGFVGVMWSAYASDAWGRKASFGVNTIPYIVGAILCVVAKDLNYLWAGRALAGAGSYGLFYSAQIYVMELAPAKARGLLGSLSNGIAVEIGYILGAFLSVAYVDWAGPTGTGSDWSWRFPFLLNILPVAIFLAMYPFMPESPRWLVQQGRADEALIVLTTLHSSKHDPEQIFAIAEHQQIVSQFQLDTTLPHSWMSMFTTYRRRTFTALLIMFGFLLGGAYYLATYGPQLFAGFGYSTRKSVLFQAATLCFLIINWIGCFLVDRVGRKPFLVIGLTGELICLCILAALSKYYSKGESTAGANAFVAFYMLNEFVVAIMEPCAYLMSAEIYPLHVRTKGVAISFGFLALTNTWVIEASSTMIQALGWKGYLLFICFSAFNVVMWVIFLPETKNVPLEEMARLFGEEGAAQVAPVKEAYHGNA
ncbi:hypothetical protein RQP46_010065 [Phenoliferia psychrophenolica]